jgi:two-component system phosphate regulon sensor histidine kinase PhoR
MKTSIFLKTLIGYIIIPLFLLLIVFIFLYNVIRVNYIDTMKENLTNQAVFLRRQINGMLADEKYDMINSLINENADEILAGITIILPGGEVIADSDEDIKDMENHSGRDEISAAFRGDISSSLRFSSTFKKSMLYVAVPVFSDGVIIAVIRMSMYLTDIQSLLNSLTLQVSVVIVLMIIINILVTLFFARSTTRPIMKLREASNKVAEGDLTTRVLLNTNDEIGELSYNFNKMVAKIESLFNEVNDQKTQLSSIMNSMQEGLLVLDSENRIILTNDAFRAMVNRDCTPGIYYWEALMDTEFEKLIAHVRKKKKSFTRENQMLDRFFVCGLTHIAAGDRVVILLHDVTENRHFEKLKKDLVGNVSHELRTPLTSIKGFVETLEEKYEEKGRRKEKRYLSIIKRNTNRLISLVEDLLTLSELEDLEDSVVREKVNLKKLMIDVCRMFQTRLDEKGLTCKLDLDDLKVSGDPFRLEQVFVNLVDNAIKYTGRGSISCFIKEVDKNAEIRIKDTGAGIPEEHIPRLFERFYVVDKSRSRELGGTGLGLSIVKHIINRHNGEIEVSSKNG